MANEAKSPHKAWTVRLGNFKPFRVPHREKPITQDVVFCIPSMTQEDVYRSLVEHDGYPAGIKVYRKL